jgi:hypothetical protein
MTRRLGPALLAVVLWVLGTSWNVGAFDRRAEILRRFHPDFVVLPRPDVVRAVSFGYRSVIADLYWIGGLNYFGDDRNRRVAYQELSNYLELVLALDPDFKFVYEFGGFALPWNRGDGWVNIDPAISILERGTKRFPKDWRMRLQLAYLYSGYRGRFKDAGDQLAAAALCPGAPDYLGQLATRMYATTGDFDGAMMIAEQIIRNTDDPDVRNGMIKRAREVQTVKDLSHLEKVVGKFERTYGRNPVALSELVTTGMITKVPEESLGGTFQYDPATGQVRSSVLHERLQVFEEPGGHP